MKSPRYRPDRDDVDSAEMSHRLTDDEREHALRVVATYAASADECREMIAMLGLEHPHETDDTDENEEE